MTDKEKVKAYDEAIERAKSVLLDCTSEERKVVEYITPELKESENGKIRKMIIRALHGDVLDMEETTKAIAWLEKQGEQMPADKVEPKFEIEEGKWYVCIRDLLDNYANKAFCKGDIYLSTQNGSLIPSNSNVPFEVVCPDTYFKDWTIQDAKDGDVLTTDTWTFIFKKYQDKSVYYHCAASTFNNFPTSDSDVFDSNYVHPTTKEQRDTLMKAMADAGYTFDFEKKKLKKIEK